MVGAEQPAADAACGDFPWIWLLSGLFPWDKHFLLQWKNWQAVLVFQTSSVTLDEATMLNVEQVAWLWSLFPKTHLDIYLQG